ncbi:MAG: M1 family metallopeptidase [Pseudomonadota bacterium]
MLCFRSLNQGLLLCAMLSLGFQSAVAAMPKDIHSHANVADFRTEHLLLDLKVDFKKKQLAGTAQLQLQRLNADALELVLDTRALSIESVQAASGNAAWEKTSFTLDAPSDILGSALRIAMPAGADRVRIRYHTAPTASGLQWLTPAQTAGKKLPLLFTQSQAIHARSWVPLQDTPGVRITYEARIRTPKALRAVMSATNDPKARLTGDYRFKMEERIPSYLLALAVGDLHFAATGPRTGIYTEPVMVQKAAKEFEDTEAMIGAAEKLYGPYRWGRYDLLILPPSFPYGGMENPRLTFASPTVITGDKALVSLVAHELAHSWSGNLVTNATWRDFWLNESFTSYCTNRIMEAVFGPERADMERVQEAEELKRDLPEVPAAQLALAPAEPGADAEEYSSIIAYNKGSLFLYNLERAYGRAVFDPFLKAWFNEHAFTSLTTEDFLTFLDERLLKANPGVVSEARVRDWIYGTALPADAVYPASDVYAKVDALRADFLAGRIPAEALPVQGWNVLHWTYFLDQMPATVTLAQLQALDAAHKLTDSSNAFLLKSWLPLAITHGDVDVKAATRRHLLGVGRRYLIADVYKALLKTDAGRAEARAIYADAKAGYHPYTQGVIEKLLKAAP